MPEQLEYFVVWNGGALLPEYASNSTLTEATRRKVSASDAFHIVRPAGPRKYDASTVRALRTLRAQGLSYPQIAKRLHLPVSTAHHLIRGRKE